MNFKKWLAKESIFGQPVDEPVPDPEQDRRSNGAFPTYEVPVSKCKKKMKAKNNK